MMNIAKAMNWIEAISNYKEAVNFMGRALEELDEYKSLGTFEDCKAAIAKTNPRLVERMPYEKAVKSGWHYACPNCGDVVGKNDTFKETTWEEDFCPSCGQALMWENR